MVRARWFAVGLPCALALALAAGLGAAQEPKKDGDGKATDKGKAKRKTSLPNYFAQIGLSPKQQDDIRKVVEEYDAKVEALRKQIEELEAEKLEKCEAALTDGQKTALKERRVAAEAEKKAKKAAKTANGDEKKPDEKK